MLISYDYDVITGRNDDNYYNRKRPYTNDNLLITWSPSSWTLFPIDQDPKYPDQCALNYFKSRLQSYPPLLLATEIRDFKNRLSSVTEGKAFILQGGDCAESFEHCKSTIIRDFIQTFNQMSGLIHYAIQLPIIKIGRIAGQYAKPRSHSSEIKNGIELPSYKGDIINGIDFTEKSRIPDPQRMLTAYYYASATLNLIRAINAADYPEYQDKINIKVYPGSTEQAHYVSFINELYKTTESPSSKENMAKPMYISHEALLLPYEESMTRQDSKDNKWYNCSAHMIWVGERTKDLDKAHVEYLRGVENPIGIKCGPKTSADILINLINKLNPNRESGKIILIIRMGIDSIHKKLPPLIEAIKHHCMPVIWMIDPMHGNTKSAKGDYKTRVFSDIHDEMAQFIRILKNNNTHPGGLHLEMTGQEVTECIGGLQEINVNDIAHKYKTLCDPRLNRMQSLEIAYLLGKCWNKA